jgi:hypothetical protein
MRRALKGSVRYRVSNGQCAGTVLLVRHVPHGSERKGKRQVAVLKVRPGSHRSLMTAIATEPKPPLHFPALRALAPRARKPIGPAQRTQVVATGLVRSKAAFKIHQRLRIILDHAPTLQIGGRLSQVNTPIYL